MRGGDPALELRKERYGDRDGAVELRGVRRQYGRGASAMHALRGTDLALPRGGTVGLGGKPCSSRSSR
ncbi:hypothetical protein [Streptomyces sp. NPDC058694]|uniref:hypothetical protein n=1 Tax=Streptomyces sp. NPDC058694 TaxID=3346603 RepID=UPI00365F9223